MDSPQAMIPPNTSGASSGAAPWFSGAPWTKLLVCVWVLVFVLQRHLSPARSHDGEEGEDLSQTSLQQLPLILQFFAFDTTGDLVMGLGFLALQLRRLEREISSVQFAEYMLLVIPIGFAIHQVLLILFGVLPTQQQEQEHYNIWNWIPPLPTLLMAASLHWYSYHTPRLYPNFISLAGGMKFSEKALMQLWGVYLLMHSHNVSPLQQEEDEEYWFVASNFMTTTLSYLLSGIISSTLYFNVLVTNSSGKDPPLILIPQWLVHKLPIDSLSGWLFLDPPPRIYAPALSGRGVPTRTTSRHRSAAVAPVAATPPPPPPVAPSPEAVAQLVAMGFPQDQVEGALRQADNNVERAADLLLMGS
ncbi:unnamed protein product [Cylindrotheca closterium]|uniref:UBA domain-containing protein n=1 Tax=Cylindrotheca closterium TaxID=2856 RepID=A0AAD2GAM9_9STRA|nr:unnamed protein product [Cylindrotheca closterium]